jgi:hypothetical protein
MEEETTSFSGWLDRTFKLAKQAASGEKSTEEVIEEASTIYDDIPLVDKIMFGIGGSILGVGAIIGGFYLFKNANMKGFFNSDNLRMAQKAILLIDVIYGFIDPFLIRSKDPKMRKIHDYVDEALDQLRKFVRAKDILDLFGVSR